MQVPSTGGVALPGAWTPRSPGPSTGFSVPVATEAPRGPAATASVAGLDGMLALQEGDRAGVRDREARRRGQAALAALAALQRALLGGQADPDALRTLLAMAEGEPAEDPELARTLRAVGLRARIELARRGF